MASALADSTFARASAISCGRLPLRSLSTASRCAPAVASASATCGLQTARIQACQHLAALDAVSLLHQNRGDPLAVVECELDLPQIDVAIEHQFALHRVPAEQPPGSAARLKQAMRRSTEFVS